MVETEKAEDVAFEQVTADTRRMQSRKSLRVGNYIKQPSTIGDNINTIVIEFCRDCEKHADKSFHVATKYRGRAESLGDMIKERLPEVNLLYNQVPGAWYNNSSYHAVKPAE